MRGKARRTAGTKKVATRKPRFIEKFVPVNWLYSCQAAQVPIRALVVARVPAGTERPMPTTQPRGMPQRCILVLRVMISPPSVAYDSFFLKFVLRVIGLCKIGH